MGIPQLQFNGTKSLLGLSVTSFEELAKMPIPTDHSPFEPHRLDFNVVLINTSNLLRHTVDFVDYELVKNQAIFISKGQVHSFSEVPTGNGYLIRITDDFVTRNKPNQLAGMSSYERCVFSLTKSSETILDALVSLVKSNQESDASILAPVFSGFLNSLESNQVEAPAADSNEPDNYSLFRQFQQELNGHIAESRDANYYTQLLGISYIQLNELCKQYSRKTAKQFIDERVVLEAKRGLKATTYPIKKIASDCGFLEVTNFNKYFKKHTGVTPNGFRNG